MDRILQINRIFDIIGTEIPKAGIRFLLIGGHAVNHYGYTRATMDVDFMIASEDAPAICNIMKTAGFTNISKGETVIFFSRPDSPLRIDFLPVDSGTMEQLMERAVETTYGGITLCVPALKDLVAMKLFAIQNASPRRRDRDLSDVLHLALVNDMDVENDLKPLCEQFAPGAYDELAQRILETKYA